MCNLYPCILLQLGRLYCYLQRRRLYSVRSSHLMERQAVVVVTLHAATLENCSYHVEVKSARENVMSEGLM